MRLLYKTSNITAKVIEVISIVLLVLMVITTCYQVILRYLFNNPTSWSGELAIIFLIWFGYLGIALAVKERGHISIDLLYDKLKPIYRNILDIFFYICLIIFSVLMIYNGKLLCSVTITQKLPATGLSKAILYFTLIIAGILIILYSIQNILRIFQSTETNSKRVGDK